MDEPKIFEVITNCLDCFVCAKDPSHAKDVIHEYLEETFLKSIEFLNITLIPTCLYHNYTMEREGQEGAEMLNFNTYIKEVRGIDDWEVVCIMDAQ